MTLSLEQIQILTDRIEDIAQLLDLVQEQNFLQNYCSRDDLIRWIISGTNNTQRVNAMCIRLIQSGNKRLYEGLTQYFLDKSRQYTAMYEALSRGINEPSSHVNKTLEISSSYTLLSSSKNAVTVESPVDNKISELVDLITPEPSPLPNILEEEQKIELEHDDQQTGSINFPHPFSNNMQVNDINLDDFSRLSFPYSNNLLTPKMNLVDMQTGNVLSDTKSMPVQQPFEIYWDNIIPGRVHASSTNEPPGTSTKGPSIGMKKKQRKTIIRAAGERPYVCELCQKSYKTKTELRKHMHVHTGERRFVCELCNKGFTQRAYLTFHMRKHTGEKPYVCEICNACFRYRSGLTYHMPAHTGEKHICEVCHKGFRSKRDLTDHNRIHTGERPFVCTICKKCFTQRSSLIVHMRTHAAAKGSPINHSSQTNNTMNL